MSRRLRTASALPYVLVSVLMVAGGHAASADDGPGPLPYAGALEVPKDMRPENLPTRHRPGRVERERSRTEFQAMSRSQALALAKDAFGTILGKPAFARHPIPTGMRVKRFLGDDGAVLTGSDARDNRLVESMGIPLTSTLGSGRRDFVDLTLERKGEGHVPSNPAVPTAISDAGTARVDDVGIRVVQMAREEAPTRDNGRLFFGNGLTDTDVVVTPALRGVEFAFQVRSARAPESATLDLDLPSGASLRSAPEAGSPVGGIEVVHEGRVIARLHAPIAWDRDEQPVAVSYALDGDRVTVQYPHRDRDVRYPLYVDPLYDYYGPDGGSDWGDGWFTRINGGSWKPTSWGAPARISNNTGTFSDGSWANLEWRNPRGYISELYGYRVGHYHSWSCGRFGITYDNVWAGWKNGFPANLGCNNVGTGQYPLVTTSDGSYGDRAVVQMYMTPSGNRTWSGYVEMYGVRVDHADVEVPTVSGNRFDLPNSTGGAWVRSGTTVSLSATASDAGLGMSAFNLFLPSGAQSKWVSPAGAVGGVGDSSAGCTGLRNSRCPLSAVTASYSFNSNLYGTGTHQITGAAYDRLSKTTPFYTTLRVDNQPPQPSMTGSLWDKRLSANANNEIWPIDALYTVHLTASDSHSGVRTVASYINDSTQAGRGTLMSYYSPSSSPCSGCSLDSGTFSRDFQAYRGKRVRVTLVAEDFAGNIGETTFEVQVAPLNALTEIYPYGSNSLYAEQVGTATLTQGGMRILRRTFSMKAWRDAGRSAAAFDGLMQRALSDNGVKQDVSVLPILIDKRDDGVHPPRTSAELDDWQQFATDVATRYGPNGQFWSSSAGTGLLYRPITSWEIWNEPNYFDGWPSPDRPPDDPLTSVDESKVVDPLAPQQYYYALARARSGLRAADPSARIVLGGLAINPRGEDGLADYKPRPDRIDPGSFLLGVTSNGPLLTARCYFDAVSFHPYLRHVVDTSNPNRQTVDTELDTVRRALDDLAAGDRQIWITEFGWSSANPDDDPATPEEDHLHRQDTTSEAEQSQKLADALWLHWARRDDYKLGPAIWYQIRDHTPGDTTDGSGGPEDYQWFYDAGLRTRPGVGGDQPKESWAVMKQYGETQPPKRLPPVHPDNCS